MRIEPHREGAGKAGLAFVSVAGAQHYERKRKLPERRRSDIVQAAWTKFTMAA